MKTIRMSRVWASVAGATALLLVIPVSMSATPGMGWGEEGAFYTGERAPYGSSYQRTPATGTEGQGFDVFRAGDGVKIDDFEQAYMGTSMGGEASGGWDVFRTGEGDPLP